MKMLLYTLQTVAFTFLVDEIIINKKRSGEDSLYLTQKPLRLLASNRWILLQLPKTQ